MSVSVQLIDRSLFLISMITNPALIVASCRKLNIPLDHYKYLIRQFALFNVFHSICHVLAKPRFHQVGHLFLIVTEVKEYYIGASILRVALCATCGCFTGSLTIFAVHFYYRFKSIEITNVHQLKYLIPILLAMPLISAATWSVTLVVLFGESEQIREMMEHTAIRPPLDIRNTSTIVFFAPSFFDPADGRATVTRAFGLGGFWAILIGSLTIVVVYVIRMMYTVSTTLAGNSQTPRSSVTNAFKNEHRQYFMALLFETALGAVLMYVPVFIATVLSFLGNDIGVLSNLLNFSAAMYPAFAPIPIFVIVRSFRDQIVHLITAIRDNSYFSSSTF